jgi:glycine/sarcosine N-methyltransferase
MHEVGFQKITTYGDFQETYHESDPDFFVHIAEKSYESATDSEAAPTDHDAPVEQESVK